MTYSFSIDTARVLNVLNANITAKGRTMAAYTLATDDLKAGRYDMMTALHVRDCGRKAKAAVKKDIFFQSMEAKRTK